MTPKRLVDRLRKLDAQRANAAQRLAPVLTRRMRSAAELFPALRGYGDLPDDAVNLLEFLDLPEVAPLQLTEPAMRLALAKHYGLSSDRIVFEGPNGPGLDCWRTKTGLLVKRGSDVLSWSRFQSVTGIGDGLTRKHLFGTRAKDASFFAESVTPGLVELATFERGLGHFRSRSQLFMYARFDSIVGQAVGNHPGATSLLKVDITRTARPRYRPHGGRERKQGFYLKAHGYPISRSELESDFPVGADAVLGLRLCVP